MRSLAILILCCGISLHAQTQGLLPAVVDSMTPDTNTACGNNCLTMADGATSGNLIVVAAVQPDTSFGSACANSNPPWTVTDTLGNTYVAETSAVTPTGGVSQNDYIQMFHTISGATGANSITVSWGTAACSGQLFAAQFTNISGTKDAITTATGGPGATPVTATTSTTTTINGDLLVSFAALNSGPQGNMGLGPALQFLSSKGTLLPEVNATFGFANAGIAGAQSLSTIRYGGNTAGSSVMQTIAFEPSAITVATTKLPDGAQTAAYVACLMAVGGSGAYTWSATAGLPAWATVDSLNTGCPTGTTGRITGTPNANATSSVTLQVTDGTHTTTKTLSLTTYSTFLQPFVANTALGTFDNGGGTVSISVNCGDVIVMQLAPGADTHGSTGWIQAQNGANSSYHDSMSLPFTPVPGIGGIISGGLQTYLIGPAITTGTDVITGSNATGTSSGLEVQLVGVRGVQGVADYGGFNNNITSSSSTTTLTTTFVAPVANELILSNTLDENTGSSISLNAPFSSLATNNDGFNEYNFGLATGQTGSVSHTASITSGSLHSQSTQLIGLRPGVLPAGCPNLVVNGEKIRRQGW